MDGQDKEVSSLFNILEDDPGEEGSKQEGQPSLFDSESKTSIWKSYGEEKGKINKFWEPRDTGEERRTSLDDLVAIGPKVIRKIMGREGSPKRTPCEGTVHPSIAGDLAVCDGQKIKRVMVGEGLSQVKEGNTSQAKEGNTKEEIGSELVKGHSFPLENIPESESGKENIPHTSTSNYTPKSNISNHCPNCAPNSNIFDSVKSKDDCKSFNIAQEVIQNLENKIGVLSRQIENYKQALSAKEERIKELEMAVEHERGERGEVDSLCVEAYIKRALEILKKIKGHSCQATAVEETKRLEVENENLKAIIEELSLRIKRQE